MNMAQKLVAPTTVQLEITTKCNHKCIHCYNPWRSDSNLTNNTLSYKKIDVILNELKKNSVWHLTITGGEPLLEFEKVKYIKKTCDTLGISVSLNSNLTCMTEKMAKRLKCELNWDTLILTSLPGLDEETCDAITQVKGSYKRIIEGIRICKRNGIRVGVNIVLTKDNIEYTIKKVEEFVKSNSVDYLALTRAIQPSYSSCSKYNFSKSDITLLADSLLAIEKNYNIEVDSLIPFPLCVLKNEKKYNSILHTKCCAGILECTIATDGSVKACSHENQTYGNIFNNGLEYCWNNMECWRNGEKLNSKCTNCKNLPLCGGECRQSTCIDYLDNEIELIEYDGLQSAPSNDELYMSQFLYNTNTKMRQENFGFCLHIEGNDYLVDTSFNDIHKYFLNAGKFSINDIAHDFENTEELIHLVKNLVEMRYLIIIND